jgi:hypothetical protein
LAGPETFHKKLCLIDEAMFTPLESRSTFEEVPDETKRGKTPE